ncbi:hypothetical protein BOTNAR_0006g00160 [Botryotinia narcissicola]|uniref:ABC transporter domain-containing protein n=1 Tax=Botryotinia narcissicola TaxID=278944 RepID=A0A4Z1JE96_9HELO|nr:hypothetical protein BOTNAR_0006g00160 [Botryotinia narcissicola]
MSWIMTSIQMWVVLIQLASQFGSRIHERLLYIITRNLQALDRWLNVVLDLLATTIATSVIALVIIRVSSSEKPKSEYYLGPENYRLWMYRQISSKSTLLLTLLQLLELQSNQIMLDDVDIKKVGLDILRQRCFITVSQDPLLLSNETLRFNLDPDASLSNETLIASLKRTELWSFLQGAAGIDNISGTASDSMPYNYHPILDKPLASFPELSVGQGQLLALCRALIKAQTAQHVGRKPVVLLDEVTSSLDSMTESIIHGIIDDEFTQKGYTVICVAHRIEVLAKHAEPGKVAVVLLSNGRLQEVITDLNPGALERLGGLD